MSVSFLGDDCGAEAVDLGLPSGTLWADRNVGALSPSDYGDYYAWGETSTKSKYSEETYEYLKRFLILGENGYEFVQIDELTNVGSNIAGTRYDVARQKWCGNWKMPTKAQFQELKDKCTWTWTTQGGHSGYKVTGPNGNSIFFPAAGYRKDYPPCEGDSLQEYSFSNVGSRGYYWSSSLHENDTNCAWNLYFRCGGHTVDYRHRSDGFTVRPVTEI